MPHDPGSPGSWMLFAQSDLILAHRGLSPGVLLETLCFHAQQAAEKAIKAVLLSYGIPIPKLHSIERLVDLLPQPVARSPILIEAAILTDYAVMFRYPGDEDPVTNSEYQEALCIADAVVDWAERQLATAST